MEVVATFIARPSRSEQLAAAVDRAAGRLRAEHRAVLSADEAVDLIFESDAPLDALRREAAADLVDTEVDVVIQPAAGRRKALLVADMDSTVIGQECIDELADFAGFKDQVAAITERAMRGEIEFEPALRERVALLSGLPAATIDRVIEERIVLTPGAQTLVWTMRANGATAILVSGGFTAFTDRIAGLVGFNENRANRLAIADGKLTGLVEEPILGRAAKLATLEETIIRLGISAEATLAVGDGANDLAMIRRAGLGVAFHAKPAVAEAAAARIDHGDLTALLFAQGYRRRDFLNPG